MIEFRHIKPGARVRVKHPRGDIRADDVFVVVERPADRKTRGLTWIRYEEGPKPRTHSYVNRVMGFHHTSLEVVTWLE